MLGILALWWTLRGQSLQLLADAIGQAHGGWVLAALASVGVTLFVVTLRWRVLFGRFDAPPATSADAPDTEDIALPPAPSLRVLFAALILGQATNIALPIRIGELLKVYVASRAGHVPVSGVLATVVVERLSDMVMLAVGAMVVVLYVALPDWLVGPTRALAITGVVAAGIIAAVVAVGGRMSAWIQARVQASANKNRTMQRLFHHGAVAVGEASNLRDWRTLTAVGVLSLLILALSASTNYLLFRAFGFPLPAVAALLLLLILQVGTAPVSTPGNVGVFQYLTVLALAPYSIDSTATVAYSMVLWAVALMPKLFVGAIVLGVVMRQGVLEPGIWAKLRGRA